MKNILLLAGAGLLLTQCYAPKKSPSAVNILNKEIRINLNQTITLTGENKYSLGEITFSHLDESRCPANTRCVRQGAAVTSFAVRAKDTAQQNVRLFIGDFMANDPRNKRNQTADTVVVQLKDNVSYFLILQEVVPYPGTSDEMPAATIIIKKP